ncbi:uncharacterized protein UBRO2_06029 [Ustilago bromivora]|uniref:Uncharacterized protein n=1 Tax=Ustilago bromivora TaxID=307758 RepID=A0A8H8TVA6_9BASI|nr:uncharacterized protein UBRO2_06029 [Ustilago bromivora]
MQDGNQLAAEIDKAIKNMTPALPAEVFARIIDWLVTPIDPNDSTLPHASGADLDYAPALPSSTSSDLLSAASSCTLLHQIASRALYRRPLLGTLKSLNSLASTIFADVKKLYSPDHGQDSARATWIRSLHLPPGDGLLQPGDTLADQADYVESLRTLFNHASRLDFVSLEHRKAGAALLQFLYPATTSRPRRLTLSNLSFSAPPFSTTQPLAPLSKLTHLHLIKIVPPPALISFLIGKTINADEQSNVPKSIEAGLSPCQTLECLRLSLLPPDALAGFGAYIGWRKAWKEYEQLPVQQQAHSPAPRAPRGPARRFAVQEALYDLATHSSRLPRLRLLLLELSPLDPLPSPMVEERENDPSATFFRVGRNASAWSMLDARETGRRGKASVADVRAKRSNLHDFKDAMQISPVAANHPNMAAASPFGLPEEEDRIDPVDSLDEESSQVPAVTPEELRTAERDKYWRLVEEGKRALIKLWRSSQTEPDVPDIRVVTARRGGHDRREAFLDFYCQAQQEPCTATATATASRSNGHSCSAEAKRLYGQADEVGCWADPDVFSLVTTAPYLSFKSLGEADRGWYWTGELPRQTSDPLKAVLPSQVTAMSLSAIETLVLSARQGSEAQQPADVTL